MVVSRILVSLVLLMVVLHYIVSSPLTLIPCVLLCWIGVYYITRRQASHCVAPDNYRRDPAPYTIYEGSPQYATALEMTRPERLRQLTFLHTCEMCFSYMGGPQRCFYVEKRALCQRCHRIIVSRNMALRLWVLRHLVYETDIVRLIVLMMHHHISRRHFYGPEDPLAIVRNTPHLYISPSTLEYTSLSCCMDTGSPYAWRHWYMFDQDEQRLRLHVLSYWLNEYRDLFVAVPRCPIPERCLLPTDRRARLAFVWKIDTLHYLSLDVFRDSDAYAIIHKHWFYYTPASYTPHTEPLLCALEHVERIMARYHSLDGMYHIRYTNATDLDDFALL